MNLPPPSLKTGDREPGARAGQVHKAAVGAPRGRQRPNELVVVPLRRRADGPRAHGPQGDTEEGGGPVRGRGLHWRRGPAIGVFSLGPIRLVLL